MIVFTRCFSGTKLKAHYDYTLLETKIKIAHTPQITSIWPLYWAPRATNLQDRKGGRIPLTRIVLAALSA